MFDYVCAVVWVYVHVCVCLRERACEEFFLGLSASMCGACKLGVYLYVVGFVCVCVCVHC